MPYIGGGDYVKGHAPIKGGPSQPDRVGLQLFARKGTFILKGDSIHSLDIRVKNAETI